MISPSTLPAVLDRRPPSRIVVHYGEIGLKGKNRGQFENRLVENIRAALRPVGGARVRRLHGRLEVEPGSPSAWRDATDRLARVFGVAYVLPAVSCGSDLPAINATVGELVSGIDGPLRFAIRCKRGAKDLPYTSVDVQRAVGAHVQELTGWPVDLATPELAIRIDLVGRTAFVALGRVEGPGGLPTGVSGRVVCLQSGGIDSPVAAYRLLQRGAVPVYVHFHSYPHTGIESQDKVRDLVRCIHPAGANSRLYMIPFAELQRRIVSDCPPPLRVVLYRRFMVRASAAIARKERAHALVTGESLGQVASQTLENIRSIDAASDRPILRPLIGWDKVDIVNEAKRIGTFETSIEPHDDCCSFLMPSNPATRTTVAQLEEAESEFDIETEVTALVSAAEVEPVGDERNESTRPAGE